MDCIQRPVSHIHVDDLSIKTGSIPQARILVESVIKLDLFTLQCIVDLVVHILW